MEMLVIAALGGVGYLISENETQVSKPYKDIDDQNILHESEIPSSKNIYHNRYTEAVFNNEMEEAAKSYKKAYVDDVMYRDFPETDWEQRYYSKSDKVVQLEKDIKNPHPFTTTRIPSSTVNQFQKTDFVKSYDLQKMTDIQANESFNSRRNNMPNPMFEKIGTSYQGDPIYKTNYPNEKSVKVYEKFHNNMEPFFGGSVKQNTIPDANRTTLENFTGTSPLYAHKKETKRFFPLVKDPFAVGGLPTSSNRETDRYVPSITRQNILPFNQIKDPPGLNGDGLTHASNIGFHDPYRPLGKGVYKDINEQRVNPKISYKGRLAGEVFWIPNGTKTAPVISRKDVDLSFTNFEPRKCKNAKSKNNAKTENFTNNFDTYPNKVYYRESRPTISEVEKNIVLDQDSIVLKETERDDTGHRLCQYPGANISDNKRNQMYNFDNARETIREQTEDNIHDKINLHDENKRGQTYYFDKAQETIREQTENNIHDKINQQDESRRGQTYYFDKAHETIREQTEDNIHDKINLQDENRRGQTYYFDKAHETIREQTEDNIHSKINPGATSRFTLHNIAAFLNATINGLREAAIVKNRAPTTVGVKAIPDKEKIGKYDIFRRQQFDTYDYTKSFNPSVTAPKNSDQKMVGELTQVYPHYKKDVPTQKLRIDPVINEQFRKNPYTQSLQSWQIPYNPKYPNAEIVAERTKRM